MDFKGIFLAMISGLAASLTQNSAPLFQSQFNTTFPEDTNKLLQPIVIPNLTLFSEQLFSPAPKLSENQKLTTKSQKFYFGKIFYPENNSQESKIEGKFSQEEAKSQKGTTRFSSRYSSENDLKENASEESEEIKLPKKTEEGRSEETESEENDKINSRNDVISHDEKYKLYPGNLDPYPTIAYYNEGDEEKQLESSQYSDGNEPGESEESEVSPTTNEPYSQLRESTSFQNSRYPDDSHENYETSSATSIENEFNEGKKEKEEKDEKRSTNDYGSENHHSVQTPLKEIKFRGPHEFKDDFDKTRTRLVSPISRYHASHNWPYSKSQLKEEAEKYNEISDFEEKETSDELNPDSKIQALVKAAEEDEAKIGRLLSKKKYPFVGEGTEGKEKIKGLKIAEEKDHSSPLQQSFRKLKVGVDEEEESKIPFRASYAIPKPTIKAPAQVWSSSPFSIDIKPTVNQKLFHTDSKSANIVPLKFNISKELTSDFKEPRFLGPVVFNAGSEPNIIQPAPTYIPQKSSTRYNFLKDLEMKEKIDQDNIKSGKIQKLILDTANSEILHQSFDHQEESDEMYNAILANIQSVFGLRTQPLKSSGRKNPQEEIHFEENRALTWALPLRKKGNKETKVKSEK